MAIISDKEVRLKNLFKQLSKKHGDGIIMKLGDQPNSAIPTYSTGSINLNMALGINGYAHGRIVEIIGPHSSGKTTLAMHAIAEVQKKGGTALLIDTEHAFDKSYAEVLGIDVKNLLICQPDYGEQALDVAENAIKSQTVDIVVIDSVSALLPEAELKGEMGDRNIGGQARLMSQAMRKLTAIIHRTGVVCIFINQIRYKIGVVYGSPETTSGGNALRFYASMRLDIRAIKVIKDRENQKIGQRVRVKVIKNKLAAPFKEAQFDVFYGKGISKAGEIVDLSLSLDLLKRAGSWFHYDKKQLGQGREAVVALIESDEALYKNLVNAIKKKLGSNT